MNLNAMDLNLVLALRALLEERNVTRAGQRVGLSQPAMSAALARLRRHFGDDLLSRVGGQYVLTPLGTALLDRAATACDLLERVFTSQAHFDPAREEREFTLFTSDYAVAVFGAELARTVHAEAPGVRLRFRQTPPDIAGNAAALLTTADGVFMPHGVIGGFPAVDLFTDRWVFLVASDNSEVGDQLTMTDLATLPWAAYQRASDALAARQLTMIGVEPRVEVSADSFQLLPFLVAGTRRVALIQESLAAVLRGVAQVRVMRPPYDALPLREAMWWHPVHTHDAAHVWLRETAARVGGMVTRYQGEPFRPDSGWPARPRDHGGGHGSGQGRGPAPRLPARRPAGGRRGFDHEQSTGVFEYLHHAPARPGRAAVPGGDVRPPARLERWPDLARRAPAARPARRHRPASPQHMTWHRDSFGGAPQLFVDLDEPSPVVRAQVQDLVSGAHVGYCMTRPISAPNEPAALGQG